MKRPLITILVLLIAAGCSKKQVATLDSIITEDHVRTVITKLASDEMKGRSALKPENINKAAAFIESQFKEIGLETFNGLSSYRQEFQPEKPGLPAMANVVGVLKGKSKPEEYVVFSAHYDHIGVLKVQGDSIANGADDDASGTTAVIELAKYFKAANTNERSLIFVTFTAEEIGGFGSKYFSQQLNPDKVVAMFNIEMIGKQSKWGQNAAFITGFERSDFGTILQKNVMGTPFQFQPDPYPEQRLFYRSDNAQLAMLGVPAHSISTDQIDSDKLYHTVDDEVESLDMKNIVAAIKAIALGSGSIVSGADTPTRIAKVSGR